MKKILCIILSLALCVLSGCSLGNDTIRFGAAGIGGMYYTFSNNFTQIASEENEKLDFQVKETAGSTANVRLLSGGYIEMGISQMDLVNDAYYGTGDYTVYTAGQNNRAYNTPLACTETESPFTVRPGNGF